MVTLKVVNAQGADQGTKEVSETVFDAEMNPTMVHDVVVAFQDAKRQGTHKTKTRAEVSGGGVKPFRQKGTGRARQGSIREPHMRGGGTVFGPRPRSYRKNIPASFRRQALCSLLSERVRKDRLCVLNGMETDAPKTKPFAQMLDKVAPEGRKTLVVTSAYDKNVLLSSRNISRVMVRTAADVNALDVISAVRVVVLEDALVKLEERLS